MKNMMMGQMMSMLGSVLPAAQEPENQVSQFIVDEIDKLYPDNEIVGMIKTTLIDVTNNDPDAVLAALVKVHNDIGEFVQGLQTSGE